MIHQQPTQKIKAVFQFILGVGLVAAVGLVISQLIPTVNTPEGWHTIQPPHDVMAMVEYQGRIWAGGRDGLFEIDPISFVLAEEALSEENPAYVSSILISKNDHNLWVGHLNGLSRFDGNSWVHYTTEDGLADNEVLALAQTADGTLLIGTAGGLTTFNGSTWKTYTSRDGLAADSVAVIAVDNLDRIWLGSRNAQSGAGSMFDGQHWHIYSVEEGLVHNSINTIFFDDLGRTWFGCGFSHLGGIAVFDGNSWEYIDSSDGLPADHIRLIYQDRFNIMWISTEYSGIIAINNQQPLVLLTPDQGLIGWEVKTMLMDSNNHLWFGTERGITVIEDWAYQQLWLSK